MGYSKGHVSSSTSSKCIICNKSTSTFLAINEYNKDGKRLNVDITIPVCQEHYEIVAMQEDILIGYAKNINKLLKGLK